MIINRNKILIVDDEEVNREILGAIFEDDYKILFAANGEEALEIVNAQEITISAILLDLVMPVMDGFEFLEKFSEMSQHEVIPVVLITGDDSNNSAKRAYDFGVADMIMKPFDYYIVKRRVENIINLFDSKRALESQVRVQTQTLQSQTRILQMQSKRLQQFNNQLIESMSEIVEFRNLESGEHVKRVKGYTRILGMQIKTDCPEYGLTDEDIEIIFIVAALHDVGKITIPDRILLKPGRLDPDEFDEMKLHTVKGREMLENFIEFQTPKYKRYSYDICRYHHEKYDGKGYPDGLVGEDIPISAQMVSVADIYDALVSERVYKKAFSKDKAFEMITTGQCGAFSDKMMDAFTKVRGQFEAMADAKSIE